MGIQIGARPDSGFDNPIGMLMDCHRRIEHFLGILCAVVERAHGRTLTQEEIGAVTASIRYFRTGGKRHNDDEEESLFPRLRQGGAVGALGDLESLEHDHETANGLHTAAETLYEKWISAGSLNEEEERELCSCVQTLRQLYSQHIRIEEQLVFPMAAQLLDPDAVRMMGEEFRRRRA